MSPEPITMTVGGIAVPATGPGRVVQETTIERLTGIEAHPGARENGDRPSRWGPGEAESTVTASETGHPDTPETAQGPKMTRSPLPMGVRRGEIDRRGSPRPGIRTLQKPLRGRKRRDHPSRWDPMLWVRAIP